MIAQPKGTQDSLLRVDFHRARDLMLACAKPLPSQMISLAHAGERVVAAVYRAEDDLIPYPRSAMDGFALRAGDTLGSTGGAMTLLVVGSGYAGDAPSQLLKRSAFAIATGAPLPLGADAVVPIENVTYRQDDIVLNAPVAPGEHVFPAGDDAKRGEVLASPGDTVTSGRAALLAAGGHGTIAVYRRPRVAIVSTGDEVVPVGDRPGPGEIRNSNATMLAVQLARDGADVVSNAHARDSLDTLNACLQQALSISDLVITTGGASVGERDLVKNALTALGARFEFRSVALRPARPTGFARCGDTLVAVLPGNPAAAFVAYVTLVRGVVRRLGGHENPLPSKVSARLTGSIRSKPERHFVIFAKLTYRNGSFEVVPLGNQCSSMVRTAADSNGLIIVPPGNATLGTGASVEVEVVDWGAVSFLA